jgi:hypothetical protein
VRVRVVGITALAAAAVLLSVSGQSVGSAQPLKYDHLTKMQKRLISGFASTKIDTARGVLQSKQAKAAHSSLRTGLEGMPFYRPTSAAGCTYHFGSNVNMDTDCQNITDADLAGRGQAQNETYISEDHYRPGSLLGSSNDYRRGDGNCFSYWSMDNGRSWGDTAVPFSFTRGGAAYDNALRQYWTAGGDTSSAFDTRGNAYFSCQVFNRGVPVTANPDLSSALLVFRSTHNGGASYNFPGRVASELPDVTGAGLGLLDKQLLTVDNHRSSPYRDRVYVTWTTFAPDGTGYIYASHSADYAETWSAPTVVSKTSPLCTNTFGVATPQGTCNVNQYSQPFTAPDGTLYVVWANFNNTVTGNDNRNQILLAKSTNGGKSFSSPIKVGDYYDLPDCATYTGQDPGRACVPDKRDNNSYFRATNYPVGVVDPHNPRRVAVTYGSYINRHSNESNGCVPTGFSNDTGQNLFKGVLEVGGCNNDILVSVSTDAGASFTGTTTDPRRLTTATDTGRQGKTDQWFQWADFTKDGRLAVSYYDRQYGDDELTGWSDFSLSGSSGLQDFGTRRVTTSSMPPPTQFEGTFWGDYTGLTAYQGTAHPAWSDTRTPELFACPAKAGAPPSICTESAVNAPRANDQEAFTDTFGIPQHR